MSGKDTPSHERVYTLIVCIKQVYGVFHMGLSFINKAMQFTQARSSNGSIGRPQGTQRTVQQAGKSAPEPVAAPCSVQLHTAACCFKVAAPLSPLAYIYVQCFIVLIRAKLQSLSLPLSILTTLFNSLLNVMFTHTNSINVIPSTL